MNTTKAWVAFIVIVLLGGAGYLGYQHYTGLIQDLQDAKTRVVALESELEIEKATTKRLAGEVETAKRRVELTKDLYKAAEDARVQQLSEIRALNTKVKELTQKLPMAIPIGQASPESAAEFNNSLMRILTLWEVFCTTADDPVACEQLSKGETS